MKRWAVLFVSLSLLLAPLNFKLVRASGGCGLCILEFGTASNLGEEYDFVIIGNTSLSSISLSSVQLQYLNSLGVYDSKISLSGTLNSGQVKLFTSDNIKVFNPSASSLAFSMYSGGGSLRLIKILTSSTTTYDTVGWGDATLNENTAISTDSSATHFYRKTDLLGFVIDTDNNSSDFSSITSDCEGLKINEIQPFATDENGQAIKSWVELIHNNPTSNVCSIATSSGNFYELSPEIYKEVGSIFDFDSYIKDSAINYIELPNPSGELAIANQSIYSITQPLLIPLGVVAYDGLSKGQSHSLVEEYGIEVWRPSYTTTRGESNIYTPSPILEIVGDENACEGIIVNEIMPNPSGSDTNIEWVEIFNLNSETKNLEQCVLSIDDEKYYFLADFNIGSNEYQKYSLLYSESGDEKSISLRNTDPTLVSMSRLYASNLTMLQSFIYEDAPEAMSYSRFEDGWAWTYTLTPDDKNIYQPIKPTPVVTESRASFAASTAKSNSNAVASTASKATAKKSTSSANSKSLSSTAKSTTGAKSVSSERDVYVEPEKLTDSNSGYVFVLIGVMAVIYALYEYKIDIQNYFLKRRRNKEFGQEDRPTA